MSKKKRSLSSSKKSKFPAWMKTFFKVSALSFIWGIFFIIIVVGWYALHLPNLSNPEVVKKRPSVVFMTKTHQEISTYGDLVGEVVTHDQVPAYLVQAILATEDRHFYEHQGIAWRGLLRALWVNLKSGRVVQGGSTLTQQVAKNLFLSNKRSMGRKIPELLITLWLETKFTKDQILDVYLNRVYFGQGTYGVDAASQAYFGKPVEGISEGEAAVLAALLKAPSRYAPGRQSKLIKSRAKLVVDNTVAAGFIKPAVASRIKAQIDKLQFSYNPYSYEYRYFTDWLMNQLPDLVNTNQDLLVITTLDLSMENRALHILEERMAVLSKKHANMDIGFVVMGPDGAILTLVGGKSYLGSQFNRITQAERQPGSAFKPFIYAAALEKGLTLTHPISDTPIKIQGWSPKNYGWQGQGIITLETAFIYSVNTAAVRLLQEIGIADALELLKRLNLKGSFPRDLTLALGSCTLTPLELMKGYTTLVNGGIQVQPYGILEIRNTRGELLYEHKPIPHLQVIDPEVSRALRHMMGKVVEQGTGKKAYMGLLPHGGKTGTTQRHQDAWFVGFKGALVAGLWLGNDDNTSMDRVSGGTLPAELWGKVMVGVDLS